MLSSLLIFALVMSLPQTAPQDGLTLFAPMNSADTFLLDESQNVVHTWSDNAQPGLAVKLLSNGNLLRTYQIRGSGSGSLAGAGGGIHELDWKGREVWGFQSNSSSAQLHHDVAVLPSGNILLLAWEDMPEAGAIAQGRNPSFTSAPTFWSEKVLELDPKTGAIIWEWRLWDHLIQEFDSNLPNFGVVANHPERVNLNFPPMALADGDWIHFNSIDYNPEFDQIVLSSRNFSEFWVIDHSTTTAEARTSSGGTYGKGGDLLYRWGSPQTYDRGSSVDQMLFKQHDVQWIPAGRPGAGNFLLFNNGTGRPGGSWSSADELTPPVDLNGNYSLNAGQQFGPSGLSWTYSGNGSNYFYADHVSGVERQENGNTLICDGPAGRAFEVDPSGSIVWDWVNTVPSTFNNKLFKTRRYQRALWSGENNLVAGVHSTVDFDIVAGQKNGYSDYVLVGNKTGLSGSTPLQGGLSLPFAKDGFTVRTRLNANTVGFQNFSGQLDAFGNATATLDTVGPLSTALVGRTLHFCFVLGDPFTGVVDFVSNPVALEILP